MKRALLVLGVGVLWVAGCKADGGGDDSYVTMPGPGRSPSGTSSPPGTAPQDALSDAVFDSGVPISGQLCVLTDLRLFGTATNTTNGCAAADLTGLVVSAGGRQTLASKDGKFSLLAPEGSFTWQVTSPQSAATVITPTLMVADASPRPVIPVVIATDYQVLLGGNGIILPAEQAGSAFIRVLDRGAPLALVKATTTPATPQLPYYDNNGSATDWRQTANTGTGNKGMVWLSGIQTSQAGGRGSVPVTLQLPTPPAPTVANPTITVPVLDQGITFFTVELQ
ncbi:MAG TPA: hypothetical protein VFP84_31720 [Kofleriaceae bacterium]|nr:hypothetical protein [Kofleriaceae bacterium]